MESHRLSDDDPMLLRLPVRRVEAVPEVARRLRGGDPGASDAAGFAATGSQETASIMMPTRTPPGRFPWDRQPADEEGTADEERLTDADTSSGTDVDGPDASGDEPTELTDWQRHWLGEADNDADDEASTPPEPEGWWEGIPAVRQLLIDGLDLGPATVFVGENGSGKSTIVEALATVYGISSAGGSTGSAHRTPLDESLLAGQLHLVRGGRKGRAGYFLRAETAHGFFTYLAENPRPSYMPPDYDFLDMSHGESFVALVEDRFRTHRPGLYILDEPESALSFDNQLRLLRHLQVLMETGRHQIVMATHSPILAALPGATLYELDHRGMREVDHDDATLVRNWRHFMNDPAAYLD